MVATHWDDMRGKQLRYLDHTWELTGDLELLDTGNLLEVEARRVDDVRGKRARFHFDVENPPDSVNPSDDGLNFYRLEQDGTDQLLVVRNAGRTYRYCLHRLQEL